MSNDLQIIHVFFAYFLYIYLVYVSKECKSDKVKCVTCYKCFRFLLIFDAWVQTKWNDVFFPVFPFSSANNNNNKMWIICHVASNAKQQYEISKIE